MPTFDLRVVVLVHAVALHSPSLWFRSEHSVHAARQALPRDCASASTVAMVRFNCVLVAKVIAWLGSLSWLACGSHNIL